MSCQYAKIAHLFGGFPIVPAIGPTETGKSTLSKLDLAYSGWPRTRSMWKTPMLTSWKETHSHAFPMALIKPVVIAKRLN